MSVKNALDDQPPPPEAFVKNAQSQMTADQLARASALVADAKDPAVDKNNVLGRLTALGHVIGGDDCNELTGQVYRALESRPRAEN